MVLSKTYWTTKFLLVDPLKMQRFWKTHLNSVLFSISRFKEVFQTLKLKRYFIKVFNVNWQELVVKRLKKTGLRYLFHAEKGGITWLAVVSWIVVALETINSRLENPNLFQEKCGLFVSLRSNEIGWKQLSRISVVGIEFSQLTPRLSFYLRLV